MSNFLVKQKSTSDSIPAISAQWQEIRRRNRSLNSISLLPGPTSRPTGSTVPSDRLLIVGQGAQTDWFHQNALNVFTSIHRISGLLGLGQTDFHDLCLSLFDLCPVWE